MDQHLGASITLSFALVIVFAIVLYQPEKHPLPSPPGDGPASPHQEPPPAAEGHMPEVTPGEPLPDLPVRQPSAPSFPQDTEIKLPPDRGAVPIAAQGPALDRVVRASVGKTRPGPTIDQSPPGPDPEPTARSIAPSTRRQARAVPPHDAFTLANEGETLKDVAIRVYGSPDEVEALWRLNRDLIGQRDVTLSAGTLLRTP
jgi:hypothetical protein